MTCFSGVRFLTVFAFVFFDVLLPWVCLILLPFAAHHPVFVLCPPEWCASPAHEGRRDDTGATVFYAGPEDGFDRG